MAEDRIGLTHSLFTESVTDRLHLTIGFVKLPIVTHGGVGTEIVTESALSVAHTLLFQLNTVMRISLLSCLVLIVK